MNDLSHMDLACIHLTDFFRFSIWVTQLHGLWILFPSKKKESVRAQLARIVMANPCIMDYLPEDSKDFVHDLGLALTTTAADAQACGLHHRSLTVAQLPRWTHELRHEKTINVSEAGTLCTCTVNSMATSFLTSLKTILSLGQQSGCALHPSGKEF